jgi:hypothetical protein
MSAHIFRVKLKTVCIVAHDCQIAFVSDCTQMAYDIHNYQ